MLTLGPAEAEEQLRDCMAIGADRGILLKTDGADWDAQSTAGAIVDAIRAEPEPFDLILFGNESADTGNYQVGHPRRACAGPAGRERAEEDRTAGHRVAL